MRWTRQSVPACEYQTTRGSKLLPYDFSFLGFIPSLSLSLFWLMSYLYILESKINITENVFPVDATYNRYIAKIVCPDKSWFSSIPSSCEKRSMRILFFLINSSVAIRTFAGIQIACPRMLNLDTIRTKRNCAVQKKRDNFCGASVIWY